MCNCLLTPLRWHTVAGLPALCAASPRRCYPQYHDVIPQGSDSVSFKTRVTRQFSPDASAGRTGVLDMANPAYSALEGMFKRHPEVNDFEDAAIPLLASAALHQIMDSIGLAIKRMAFPLVARSWLDELDTNLYGGNRSDLIVAWATNNALQVSKREIAYRQRMDAAGTPLRTELDYVWFPLPLYEQVAAVDAISAEVATALWDPTFSLAIVSFVGWGEMIECYMSFKYSTPLAQQAPFVVAYVRAWHNEFNLLDPRYMGNDDLVLLHLEQLFLWVGTVLRPGNRETNTRGTFVEQRIAGYLHAYDSSIMPTAAWKWVIGAQLGHNALAGKVMWDFHQQDTLQGKWADEGMGARQFTSVHGINECDVSRASDGGLTSNMGGSMSDNDLIRLQPWNLLLYWSPPEISCACHRYQPVDLNDPPTNFLSKLTAEQTVALVELFTSGDSMPHVPAPVSPDLVTNGSASIAKLYFGIKDIWYDKPLALPIRNLLHLHANTTAADNTSYGGVMHVVQSIREAKRERELSTPGTDRYQAAVEVRQWAAGAYDQSVSDSRLDSMNTLCNDWMQYQRDLDIRALGLTCYQMHDVVFWLDTLAREFIFKGQYMWRAPDSNQPNTEALYTGPILRMESGMYLESGLPDRLYEAFVGFKYPGAVPRNYPDMAAWAAHVRPYLKSDTVNTGKDINMRVGLLQRRNESRALSLWGKTTYPDGSFHGLQFRAQLKRHVDATQMMGSVTVWDRMLERPMELQYVRTERYLGTDMEVWVYEQKANEDIPKYPSDLDKCRQEPCSSTHDLLPAAPTCLASLRAKVAVSDDKPGLADMMWGRPFGQDCDEATVAMMNDWQVDFLDDSLATWNNQVVIEPQLGQAVYAQYPGALYIRWGPSRWYNTMKPAIIMTHTVMQKRKLSASLAQGYAASVAERNFMIDNTLPGLGWSFGLLLGLVCVFAVLMFKRRVRYEASKIKPPKVRSFKEAMDDHAERYEEARQSLLQLARDKKLRRADKRSNALRAKVGAEASKYKAFVIPEPTPAEIEKEMGRLAERKAHLAQAALQGRRWALDHLPHGAVRPESVPSIMFAEEHETEEAALASARRHAEELESRLQLGAKVAQLQGEHQEDSDAESSGVAAVAQPPPAEALAPAMDQEADAVVPLCPPESTPQEHVAVQVISSDQAGGGEEEEDAQQTASHASSSGETAAAAGDGDDAAELGSHHSSTALLTHGSDGGSAAPHSARSAHHDERPAPAPDAEVEAPLAMPGSVPSPEAARDHAVLHSALPVV